MNEHFIVVLVTEWAQVVNEISHEQERRKIPERSERGRFDAYESEIISDNLTLLRIAGSIVWERFSIGSCFICVCLFINNYE